MAKRFVSIWFPHLITDWFTIGEPLIANKPFVVRTSSHGRMVIAAANQHAQIQGVYTGMVLADARAIIPSLEVADEKPGLAGKLLKRIAEWCIRFSPFVAVDAPEGIILDATGCSHLWGGEALYLTEIAKRLQQRGYHVRVAITDSVGPSWAVARFGKGSFIVDSEHHIETLLPLPAASLRLEPEVLERLDKLGLRQVRDFLLMPRSALRRRFGQELIEKIKLALGEEEEIIQPVIPLEPYQERLPCLEPIVTATGIEIALQRLLDALCQRLQQEQKGLRMSSFKCYRVDGKIEELTIGTNRPSYKASHLFKLYEIKLPGIEPAMGIELFTLDATKVEEVSPLQEKLWENDSGMNEVDLAELLDRLAEKIGAQSIHRYLPDEHYWPERSFKSASSLDEESATSWKSHKPRPLHLLPKPELVDVTAPIPDYPPMLFRHKGKLHKIIKADGPERIEQEWWLQQGEHRDYYCVEDDEGSRYWLFRSGHYSADKSHQWFLHGFFA